MKNRQFVIFLIMFFWILQTAEAGLLGSTDKQPPIIKLTGKPIPSVVFMEKMMIEGEAEDENGIVSLMMNQEPVVFKKGNRAFFSHIAKLDMGKNVLTLEAADSKGNTAAKTIQVERRLESQIQLSERLRLAVLPFIQDGGATDLMPGFQDSLVHSLAKRNRFQMIERHHMDLILQEQDLTRTNLFDPKTASKIDHLVSAGSVITGKIGVVQGRMLISAEMVDVETSKIISRQEIWGQLNEPLSIKNIAEGLALKFHQDFPLVDGHIIEIHGRNIVVDLGQTSLKPDRRLIIFREDPVVHPVTGEIIGTEARILGHARVTQVMQNTAIAAVMNRDGAALMMTDRVMPE